MTCHGFGGGKVRSSKASPDDIRKIAERIQRECKKIGVTSAHVVQPKEGTLINYDIIFEFWPPDYPSKHPDPRYYEELRNQIRGISEGGHSILSVDLWIIQKSYPEETHSSL